MKKKSKGLGDTIQKITKALKIPTCLKCDERRKQLNKAMPYVRKMNNDEYNEFMHFIESDKLYTLEQQEYIIETLSYTTGIRLKTCVGCTPETWEFWINKIKETINN